MLPLFFLPETQSAAYSQCDEVTFSERLVEILDGLEPDSFSPREALSLLYELKAEHDNSGR